MSKSNHPPNTEKGTFNGFTKMPKVLSQGILKGSLNSRDFVSLAVYYVLSELANHDKKPKTVPVETGDRRPPLQTVLKQGQCVASLEYIYRAIDARSMDMKTSNPIRDRLRKMEQAELIICETIYLPNTKTVIGTRFTLREEAPPDVWITAKMSKKASEELRDQALSESPRRAHSQSTQSSTQKSTQSSEEIQASQHFAEHTVEDAEEHTVRARNIDIDYNKGCSIGDTNSPNSETQGDPESELSTFPESQSIGRAEDPTESKANDPPTAREQESRAIDPEEPPLTTYPAGDGKASLSRQFQRDASRIIASVPTSLAVSAIRIQNDVISEWEKRYKRIEPSPAGVMVTSQDELAILDEIHDRVEKLKSSAKESTP